MVNKIQGRAVFDFTFRAAMMFIAAIHVLFELGIRNEVELALDTVGMIGTCKPMLKAFCCCNKTSIAPVASVYGSIFASCLRIVDGLIHV